MDGMPAGNPSPLPITAPQAGPMSVPSPKEGLQQKAKVEIQQALQLLKKNLSPEIFQVHGPEWKALDSAIRGLAKVAGEEDGKEMSGAGLRLVASALNPKGMQGVMGAQSGGGMTPGGPQPKPNPLQGIMQMMGGGA